MQFLVFLFLSSAPAQAALKATDFYCRSIPISSPLYFRSQSKACAVDAKAAASPESICVESVLCAFVDEKMKNTAVTNAAGKQTTVAELPLAEKNKYFAANIDAFSWLPSTLTCRKVSSPGSSECPPADKCKGDINYAGVPGTYAADKVNGYLMTAPQSSEVFRNGDEPEGATAR